MKPSLQPVKRLFASLSTQQVEQKPSRPHRKDSYSTTALRGLKNSAGIVAAALALAFVPTVAANGGGDGGGGGGHGGGEGFGGRGGGGRGSAIDPATAAHQQTFGSGTRTSGRDSSGLSSGNGLSNWRGVGAGFLLGDALGHAGQACNPQTRPFQSNNGTEFAMAGCDASQMNHVQAALEQVCGMKFNVNESPKNWSVIGTESGITYAAQNAATLNTTGAAALGCIKANGDAHQGLSDGAIAGIVIGSVAGGIILLAMLFCCCSAAAAPRRERSYELNNWA